MKSNIPAVIFAGGKSSRMGKDKSLLPFKDFPTLTQFQHHKLSQIFNKVYISTKIDKFNFECSIIKDNSPISSPLVGIISVLETIKSDKVFILSVDAPFVEEQTIKKLLTSSYLDKDALISSSPQGVQPLCGIYNKSILKLAKKQLSNNNHKLNFLLKQANTQYIEFNDEKVFMNLNYFEEYEKALSLLK